MELIFDAATLTDAAQGFKEAGPVRRIVLLVEGVGTAFLVTFLLGESEPWAAFGVIAAVVLLDLVGRRLVGSSESQATPDASERKPSPEEVRIRAAAERAERELAERGSHPLGHPGGGGRLQE